MKLKPTAVCRMDTDGTNPIAKYRRIVGSEMQDCLCTVFAKEVCSRAFRTDPFTIVTIYCYRRYHLICKHIVCLVGTVITCYLYPMATIITIENIFWIW